MRKIRAIYIKAEIYPWQNLQDTPAGKEQIENARKFIAAIEEAAARLLPANEHRLKVEERYVSDTADGK
jgi:hypothetical protein